MHQHLHLSQVAGSGTADDILDDHIGGHMVDDQGKSRRQSQPSGLGDEQQQNGQGNEKDAVITEFRNKRHKPVHKTAFKNPLDPVQNGKIHICDHRYPSRYETVNSIPKLSEKYQMIYIFCSMTFPATCDILIRNFQKGGQRT